MDIYLCYSAVTKNWSSGIRILLIFLSFLFITNSGYGQGTWVPVTATAPNASAGVMVLLTDGTVLAKSDAGGGEGKFWNRLKPDINGSYANGTWTSVGPMIDDRLYFSTQILRDGRMYVCGGEYGAGGSKGEVYDPIANTWTATPLTGFFVSDANSEILPDGRVLQACVGSGTRHTRLWDPVTNTYALGPDCLRTDNEAAWLKLPDNSVLFVDNYSTTSERYIPATNTWINDGTVPVNIYDPFGDEAGGAFLLPDGRGFFVGSSGHNALYTPSGTVAPGSWAAAVDIPGPSGTPDAASSIMVDGKILIAASDLPTSGDHFPTGTRFYEYDYVTNSFISTGAPGGGTSMAVPSYYTNMLALPDGRILFVNQGDNRYYEYIPAGAPLAAGKPTVSAVIRVACDTFTATGTLFNGISEGASYGDDWQMETNYPIIRLISGTNVYYARTTNWNSTGVMRGAAPDTTKFVLPPGLPVGAYKLQVVVNGIASDSFDINTGYTISPATSHFCANSTNTLSDIWPGGTWTSANTAIATVDPASGVVSGVSGGVTTISYFLGTCFGTATVTIDPAPAAIFPSGGINICQGSVLALSDATPLGSWSSTNPAIATVGPLSGSVTGISPGAINIAYTVAGCSSVAFLTVNPLPGATVTPAGTAVVCSGSSLALNANTGAGFTYQWYLGGVPVGGATNSLFLASAAGSYSVAVTSSLGCVSSSAVTTVTLIAPPPATITPGGPTIFCTGGSVALNANIGAGLTYQWQLGGSNIFGAVGATYTANATGNYSVIVTNTSGCSTTSLPTAVTVTPGPGATITPAGPTTFCAPGSVLLNANTGVGITYQWQVGGVAISGATTSSYTATASGNYTVIVSQGVCVVTSPGVIVTVNSTSAGTITGPTAVCIGQTIALFDASLGGTWTSSNPAIATVNSLGVVTGISGGAATITYSVTSFCGTGFTTSPVNVSVGTTVAPITGTLAVCPGGTTVLSDITPAGSWSSSNPAVATIGNSSGIVTGIAVGSTDISYSVINLAGCVSSYSVLFNVGITFTAVITPAGPTTFCTGANVLLNATTGSGLTYQWLKNGVTIPGAVSSGYVAGTSGNYSVIITAPGGCNSISAPVTITVTPGTIVVPAVTIAASPGTLFCLATSPTTFTAIPAAGGTPPAYQWYVNSVATVTGPVYSYTPAAGDIVTCVMTSNAPCAFPATATNSVAILVTTLQTPSVSITPDKSGICTGDSITFSSLPLFGGSAPTYTWRQNGIYVHSGPSYRYAPANGDVLICTMTSNYPCVTANVVNSPSYTVVVHPIIPNSINIYASHISIAPGAVDTFIAVAPYGGTSPVYQWRINGAPVPGATTSMFITSSLTNGQVVSCEVTSSNPCVFPRTEHSSGDTITVWGLGVQQVSGTGGTWSLVPNPNKGSFTIDGTVNSSGEENVTIVITNMLGQVIDKETVAVRNGKLHRQVSLGDTIASGVYIVSITSGSGHEVFHMVIEK